MSETTLNLDNPADWPVQTGVIENVEGWEDDPGCTVAITWNGWTYAGQNVATYRAAGVTPAPGQPVTFYGGFGRVVQGLDVNGRRVFYSSQAEAEAEHQRYRAQVAQEALEQLEASRADWWRREGALPDWGRRRLARFRAAGEHFEREGWGYELIVCELAALYLEHPDAAYETPAIRDYDGRNGCSGNQHDCARMLARLVQAGRVDDIPHVPAALSPLTGSADYAGVGATGSGRSW